MRRAPRPSFVVTFAALSQLGCRVTEPTTTTPPSGTEATQAHGEPPVPGTRRRKRTIDSSQVASSRAAPDDLGAVQILNPTTAAGQIIYADATDKCFTSEPDPHPRADLPSGMSARITRLVDCPPEMDDPAWDTCNDRVARSKTKDECYCLVSGGNPPPPPSFNACPRR